MELKNKLQSPKTQIYTQINDESVADPEGRSRCTPQKKMI